MFRHKIPTCEGCGAKGYYTICRECTLPETPWEPHNRSVPTVSHNDYNYHNWW